MLTLLQVAENGLKGLVAQQGKRSVNISCQYRGPNGLKCFLGHSIPDAVYELRFEHTPLAELIHGPLSDIFSRDDYHKLVALQGQCHDGIICVAEGKPFFEEAKAAAIKIAKMAGYPTTSLQEIEYVDAV